MKEETKNMMNEKKVDTQEKEATPQSKPKYRKAERKIVSPVGKAFIITTFNNTIVTITDLKGNTITWGTTGVVGFKGTKKSTPYAATKTTEMAAQKALEKGVRRVSVYVKGPGVGRDNAIRALKNVGLQISSIADITPIPHNGCRPKKRRRV